MSPASQPGGGGDMRAALRAEWTKFRTVRGWVIGLVFASLMIVLFTYVQASGKQTGYCTTPNPDSCVNGHQFVPTGPDGEAVADSYELVAKPLTGADTITARIRRPGTAAQDRIRRADDGVDILHVIDRAANNHGAGVNGDQRQIGRRHGALQNTLEVFHVELDDHLIGFGRAILSGERQPRRPCFLSQQEHGIELTRDGSNIENALVDIFGASNNLVALHFQRAGAANGHEQGIGASP